MTRKQLLAINTFAELCAAMGKKESDYDVEKGKTASQKVGICLDRLRLIYKAYNGKKKPDIANTDQPKYLPWVRIIKDKKAPFGFRLSYDDCGCVRVFSYLGARPYLLDSSDVKPCFEKWQYEHEQMVYWDNQANQE